MTKAKAVCILLSGVTAAGHAGSVPGRAELLVDVDVFDNQTVATSHYDAPFYGPDQIEALFARCRSNGVTKVTWRAQCQIASYASRLNYTIADVPRIRSNADERRAEGAFAAKVGVMSKVKTALPELKRLPFGGLVQRVENASADTFAFSGALSSVPLPPVSRVRRLSAWLGLARPAARGAFLAAIEAGTGAVLARGAQIVSEKFQTTEIRFACAGPFYVGVFSYGRPDLHVFVADALALKDGAGRERLSNGGMEESDGLLEPSGWRLSGANFVTLNGDYRVLAPELKKSSFPNGDGAFKILHRPHTEELFTKSIEAGDPLAAAGRAARRNGVELYAWFDPLDDGRRALPPVQAWSSKFLEEHPECRAVDREGRARWGLLCFGYPEVRAYKTAVVKELLSYEGVTGVALKMNYQHNSIWDGNRHDYAPYLYNDVALRDYHARWGKPENGAYDIYKLRMIYGGYVMEWLRELRPLFEAAGKRLCLFQAPTSLLDTICGGWVLPPERLIGEKLCDDFLIEPRIHGDAAELLRTSERIRSLVWHCRQNGVRVGYDHWLPGAFGKVPPAGRGAALREQLLALSRENVDFIGIYEEMCLVKPDLWPVLGEVSRAIAATPARALPDDVPAPRLARNVLAADKDGSAWSLASNGVPAAATELIDGDESSNSSVTFESWPVVVELTPRAAARINTAVLKGGHLGWKNQCAPEDVKIEGLSDGAWRLLADERDVATRNRHDNARPRFFRFAPVTVDRLRVTVTRGSDAGQRYLVLREIEAFFE
jgi:hypothetical protein